MRPSPPSCAEALTAVVLTVLAVAAFGHDTVGEAPGSTEQVSVVPVAWKGKSNRYCTVAQCGTILLSRHEKCGV